MRASQKAQSLIDFIASSLLIRREAFFDAGCGFGLSMLHACKVGFQRAAGIEIDAPHADIAEPFFRTAGLPVRYLRGDLLTADIGDKFDLILNQDVLEHVQDIDACLHRIDSLLSDDGVALIRVASGRCVGVVHVESHYRAPLLSLFDSEGAAIAQELVLIRSPNEFVVVRWPTVQDLEIFQRRSKRKVFFNQTNPEVPGAHFDYTVPMWRDRLAKLDQAVAQNPVYQRLNQTANVRQWRSEVDRLLAAKEAGRRISPFETMEYFASYWLSCCPRASRKETGSRSTIFSPTPLRPERPPTPAARLRMSAS